jgi:hypothetical protein
MTARQRGTLVPHQHVGPEIGWAVAPDSGPENPFPPPLALAATDELRRAGVPLVAGTRVSFATRAFGSGRSHRATNITLERT